MNIKTTILTVIAGIFISGFLVPDGRKIPVAGATSSDWHQDSFWYEPWGRSGVHKGIDVFASKGTAVIASTNMLILRRDHIDRGGKVVIGLGPKWRLHYFAHLESIDHTAGRLVATGTQLGTVGDSGNAKGKPAHLHYSVLSLVPIPWLIDNSSQGYKKAFYMDPANYFKSDKQ